MASVLAWVPMLVQLIVKVGGLQVMDQGNREQDQEVGYQVATWKGRKNDMKKKTKKGLNEFFIASTKVIENRGERVNKTNKPINKQAVHLD